MKTSATQKDIVLVLSHGGQSFLEEWLKSLGALRLPVAVLTSTPKAGSKFETLRSGFAWSKKTRKASLEMGDVIRALDHLSEEGYNVRCVVSVWEAYRPLVAEANALVGAPDLSPADVDRLRDKFSLRKSLQAHELSNVNAELLSKEVLRARKRAGARSFIKPRFGIASFGAFSLKPSTTWAQILTLQKEMRSDADYSDYFLTDSGLIVEDYIEGQEFSFEIIAGGGDIKILAIHEKVELEAGNQTTLETACVSPPSSLDSEALKTASAWMARVFAALEIGEGCFHAEARFDGKRWEIIEINPRVGGAYILESARLICKGFSILDGLLRLLLEPSADGRKAYLKSLGAIGIGGAAASADSVRTFFRVFFAEPARTIKDISVQTDFIAPAFSKTFMKAGTATADSSRELFMAQALWKLEENYFVHHDIQDLKNKTRDYYRVEYL